MARVRRFAGSLSRSYRLHHEANPSLLDWIGVVGAVALSAFLLVRLTGRLPPRWDDLPFRLPAIALCTGLALRRWWPVPLVRWYLPYSYLTVFYCLAFFMPLTLLENGGAPNTVLNMMLGAVLVTLLTDWRNTLLMVVGGYAASAAWYAATQPMGHFPLEFFYWWVPLCLVLVAAGCISKYAERRAELGRLRRLYAGLAGSIAHEVRNPMSHVQHALETASALLPPAGAADTALPRAQLDALRRALGQGLHAVERGLQSVTITLQQVNGRPLDPRCFEPLSAADCVRKAVAEYAYEQPDHRQRVEVRVEQDFVFFGDETVGVLVLFNLLKNALYYLPLHPAARITLEVSAEPVHCIRVRDTGPGIPAERLPLLFEEFHSYGKAEGTGLGLAFCRRAMAAFGGDIACRSELGKFTEFTLSFPPAADTGAAAATARAQAPGGPGNLEGRTVLVVDDSSFNRSIVKARLRELGLSVLEAAHGHEALRLLDEGAVPDAILMDMQMPGLSGVQTTRELRRRAAPASGIPVLALSANDLPTWRQAARDAGMDGYLSKPLQPELLVAELGRVLQDAGRRTAHSRPEPAEAR